MKYDLTYLSIDSGFEGVGSSQIIPLIEKMSKLGLNCKLITFEKTKLNLNSNTESNFEWLRLPFESTNYFNPIKRIIALRSELDECKIIHGRSDFATFSALKNNSDIPVIWDIRSFWWQQRAFIENKSMANPGIIFARLIAKTNLHYASGINTLTYKANDWIKQTYPEIVRPMSVVSTIADLEMFKPKKTKKNNMILMSGTYNNYYDLELTKLFINHFRYENYNIHWARPRESATKSLNIGENLVFSTTRQKLANLIPEYSFGIAICKLDAGVSLLAAAPTKIAEYLACGIPVVVSKGLGDYEEIFSRYRVGVVIDDNPINIESGAQKLKEILRDPQTPETCRYVATKYFSLTTAVDSYLKLYSELIPN